MQAHSAPMDIIVLHAGARRQPARALAQRRVRVAARLVEPRARRPATASIWMPFNADGTVADADQQRQHAPPSRTRSCCPGATPARPRTAPGTSRAASTNVRPVGVAVSPVDGALYISSDSQGYVYRVGLHAMTAAAGERRRSRSPSGAWRAAPPRRRRVQAVAPQGTQPGGLAGGTPPADVASKCSSCHAGGIDDDGKTFRPWDTWSGTMMANAMRDPLFLAALTVSEQDAPGVGRVLPALPHAQGLREGPRHRRRRGAGRRRQAGGRLRGLPPFDRRVGGAARAHARRRDDRRRWPRWIRRRPTSATRGCTGTRATSATAPTTTRTAPRTRRPEIAFTSSSELCGQCHEVLSPLRNLLDAAGTDTGFPFPLDNTYTEWAVVGLRARGAPRSRASTATCRRRAATR